MKPPICWALSAASSHARDNPPRSKPSTMRSVTRFLAMVPASLFLDAVAGPSRTVREGKRPGRQATGDHRRTEGPAPPSGRLETVLAGGDRVRSRASSDRPRPVEVTYETATGGRVQGILVSAASPSLMLAFVEAGEGPFQGSAAAPHRPLARGSPLALPTRASRPGPAFWEQSSCNRQRPNRLAVERLNRVRRC